jgi:hypothetical protein
MTVALALALCAASPAAPESRYEQRVVNWALDLYGRVPEPNPEGKRIEEILVASEDIIAPTDPWPMLANDIHVKTKDLTVRRQLLFDVGQPYSTWLAQETERNMRTLFIFAVARVIPVKGLTPDGVGVLVVTKDLWSIRADSAYNIIGPLLQFLQIRPTEENFLGLDKTVQLDFQYRLDTLWFGALYYDPRIAGSRWEMLEQADILFNRGTKNAEGTVGQVVVDRPLFSLETEWSFSMGGSWDVERTRNYLGADIWQLPYPNAQAPTALVPYEYDTRVFSGVAGVTRSFGHFWKTNVTLGFGGYVRRYSVPYDPIYSDDERTWLTQNYLPYSETATYFTASALTFQANYRVLRDIDTFALSEDFQLGHSVLGIVRWAEPAWGSPSRFIEGGVSARYRAYRFDDFFSLEVAAATRFMPNIVTPAIVGPWVNQRVAAEVRNYSPSFGIGRLVTRFIADWRRNDLNHGFDLLGGDLGLRGVAPDALQGTAELLVNVEYRTRPLELYTVHAGLVFFYDAGSAFDGTPNMIQTVGIGIRALFPQLDVQPVRIDIGYAFIRPPTPLADSISSSFGQVTDFRLGPAGNTSFLDAPLN